MSLSFEQIYNALERSTAVGPELDALRFMEQHGSAVRVQFGKDGNEMWECEWIAKGPGLVRGTGRTPATAILSAMVDYMAWKRGRDIVLDTEVSH